MADRVLSQTDRVWILGYLILWFKIAVHKTLGLRREEFKKIDLYYIKNQLIASHELIDNFFFTRSDLVFNRGQGTYKNESIDL